MIAYILRRLLLIVPTIFGIMLVTFVVVQFAPGGPVEKLIAQLSGTDPGATSMFSGGGGDFAGKPGQGGVPGDVSVECDALPSPASPSASDSCDPAPVVTMSETSAAGSCPQAVWQVEGERPARDVGPAGVGDRQ